MKTLLILAIFLAGCAIDMTYEYMPDCEAANSLLSAVSDVEVDTTRLTILETRYNMGGRYSAKTRDNKVVWERIYLAKDSTPRLFYHEYGHKIMFDLYGRSYESLKDIDRTLAEGWAIFMEMLLIPRPYTVCGTGRERILAYALYTYPDMAELFRYMAICRPLEIEEVYSFLGE